MQISQKGKTQAAIRDEMDGGLIQLVIPAEWVFAAVAAADITGTVGVSSDAGLISGATDKTVRVELADDFTAAAYHHRSKHSGAYPQPPHRWRSFISI